MATGKQYCQALLKRAGLYERLRASPLYDAYWVIADKRMLARRSAQVEFYREVLSGLTKGSLIFDVGANRGSKTDVFLRLGARVVAVEPDEASQQVLREKFLRYRFVRKPVVVVDAALSDRITGDTLWIERPGSAMNTLSRKWVELLRKDERRFGQRFEFPQQTTVRTTTLDELIARHGVPYFVKIDVEGFEPNVLRGLRCAVPYLSFEVNLPEFCSEGRECIGLLRKLAADGMFNYTADCQRGLALEQWVGAQELFEALGTCGEGCVEVFWTTQSDNRLRA